MEITGSMIATALTAFFAPLILLTAFGAFMYWLGRRSVPVYHPDGQHGELERQSAQTRAKD